MAITMENLPIEILSLIADHLDEIDLLSFHSTSSRLYFGSDTAFKRRICQEISVDVSLKSLKKWRHLLPLPPGKEHTAVQSVIINPPLEMPEVYFFPWYNSSTNCAKRFRYATALEKEERWLLSSGRFTLDILAILNRLPNATRIQVKPTPSIMSWAVAQFMKALLDCKNVSKRIAIAVEFMRGLSEGRNGDKGILIAVDLCENAVRVIEEYFSYSNTSAYVSQSEVSEVAEWAAENWHLVTGTLCLSTSGNYFKPRDDEFRVMRDWAESATFRGGEDFFQSLIATVVMITGRCTRKARELSVSIGWVKDRLIQPELLVLLPSRQITIDRATSNVKSLELCMRWPGADYKSGSQYYDGTQQYLDDFLRYFPAITELTLHHDTSMECFAYIYNVMSAIRIDALKKICLWNWTIGSRELAELIQPGQWQNLQELCLANLYVEDSTLMTCREAWTMFLRQLEELKHLSSFRLVNMLTKYNERFCECDPISNNKTMTWKRDPLCSWEGRLSKIVEKLDLLEYPY